MSPQEIRQLYQNASVSELPNYCGAKVKVQSKLNIPAWRKYENIIRQKDETLVDQLEYGFTMGIDYSANFNVPTTNHLTARKEFEVIDSFIIKHWEQNSLLGPFKSNPLPVEIFPSPMQVVTSASGKKRAVLDMSYPATGSVNSAIPKVWTDIHGFSGHFTLPTHDNVCNAIVNTPNPVMFITDLRGYYMQIPSDPKDMPYLVISWRGAIYIHRRLPFGCRSSCLQAQRVTDAICLVFTRLHSTYIDGYVDDFVTVVTLIRSASAYAAFHQLLHELGCERSEEKDQLPDFIRIFLGLQYNLQDMIMSIPEDKVLRVIVTLNDWLNREVCSKSQVQSLLGHLNHLAAVVHAGRPFTCHILDILKAGVFPATITTDLKADIRSWLDFLQSDFNSSSIIKSQANAIVDSVLILAVKGQTCVINCCGLVSAFVLHSSEPLIPYRDMFAVAAWLAVVNHSDLLVNSVVKVAVPTKVAACVLNRAKTSCVHIRPMLREMWILQAKGDYVIKAVVQKNNNCAALYEQFHEFREVKLPK